MLDKTRPNRVLDLQASTFGFCRQRPERCVTDSEYAISREALESLSPVLQYYWFLEVPNAVGP